ncbi:MAG TPA: gamma carbonic anhydrase family protein [Rhodanobacteraceae bacterium]
MTSIRSWQGIHPVLGARIYVDDSAVVIGDVQLGDDVSVWPMAVIRGDVQAIRIGARSNVQDGVVIHVTHDGPYSPGGRACHVGADVTIGHGAILHACTVGDTCLIGMHASVLDGVIIEPHAFIGAGALVTPGKHVGTGELWAGNPARKLRDLSEREIAQLDYSAAHYVEIKDQALKG